MHAAREVTEEEVEAREKGREVAPLKAVVQGEEEGSARQAWRAVMAVLEVIREVGRDVVAL